MKLKTLIDNFSSQETKRMKTIKDWFWILSACYGWQKYFAKQYFESCQWIAQMVRGIWKCAFIIFFMRFQNWDLSEMSAKMMCKDTWLRSSFHGFCKHVGDIVIK
jgi:hypothetical protein